MAARRPRVSVSRAQQEAVVERFLAAVRGGDVPGLLDVLAPDVVVRSDGGGVVSAALRPSEGAPRVAAFVAGLARTVGAFETVPVRLNGEPAIRIDVDGAPDTVARLVVEGGRITQIFGVRNPHKLARVEEETALSR